MSLKRSVLTLGLITAAGVVLYLTRPEEDRCPQLRNPTMGAALSQRTAFSSPSSKAVAPNKINEPSATRQALRARVQASAMQ